MNHPTLKTSRLLLCEWTLDDREDLFHYAKDPQVGPPCGWPPHQNPEESDLVLKIVLIEPNTWAITRLDDPQPIGSISLKCGKGTDLTDREDECELGYWLARPFWGQGLVPEAAEEVLRYGFEDLGMNKIWCGYFDGNEKSRRVQEKLGFKYARTIQIPDEDVRKLAKTDLEHVSVLSREDWAERRKQKQTC